MKQYIDKAALVAEIEKLKELIDEKWKELADNGAKVGGCKYDIEIYTYLSVLKLIESLQQEQPECMASQGETAEVGYWNQRGLSLRLDKSLEKLGYKDGDKVIIQIRKK